MRLRKAQQLDGQDYYEYVLVYIDDILCVSCNPKSILWHLDQHFMLKKGSMAEPTQYLGAKIKRWTHEDGKPCWAMGLEQYVKEAIKNVMIWAQGKGWTMRKWHTMMVLPSQYRPELDTSRPCDDEEINYYQQHVGVLRWTVEF